MLVFGIPTLNCYDLLNNLLKSIESNTVIPDRVIVVDNGRKFRPLETTLNLEIVVPKGNLGVAGSWNRIIEMSFEQDENASVIISNDDLVLGNRAIENMVNSDSSFVLTDSSLSGLNMFSLYLIRKACTDKVGMFDSLFYPAYFEDNDFYRRMTLAEIETYTAKVEVQHIHGGSQTIKKFTPDEMETHHRDFRKNQMYYIQKWGGLPHHEKYTIPFNGEK